MDDWPELVDEPFVSTGTLPPEGRVEELVDHAHRRFGTDQEGSLSNVYPALLEVDPDLFGICVTAVDGRCYGVGDAEVPFTIMSVSKPFVFALVCEARGVEETRRAVGVNATGLPFNSVDALGLSDDARTNPMVNPGALATTSLAPGKDAAARWAFVLAGLQRFAGRGLSLDDEVFASASAMNQRNRLLAAKLAEHGRLAIDAAETVDIYTRQCSLSVTAVDLAVMGATLADGGVNPLTREVVVSPEVCRATLAVMTTSGLYETSGDWLFDVGLPGKSGIGGGIVTVSPGKGALGTFAPLLDAAGNSVKGQHVARFLSSRLGLDLFASEAAR